MPFDNENFKNKIISLRKSHYMLQQNLGDLLKLERSTIAYYETGRITPSFDTLVKITSIFNVSTDYLLGVSKDTDI